MYAVPALDAAGAKLYIGSDAGIFYCRNTADGTSAAGWTDFVVSGSGDRRIRSGAALDPNSPLGSTVYFHCNNGYLYALDANTGAWRWMAHTSNEGGPPTDDDPPYPQPLSSSPAVSANGTVYVGSKDGHVYGFNPSTGATVLDKTVGTAIEAPVVIGNNGWIYGATRFNDAQQVVFAFAINPVTATVVWQVTVGHPNPGLGVIVSPVIDQSGLIYVAEFSHTLVQLDGATGATVRSWFTDGKLCQTPTLLQNGLLLIGQSIGPRPGLPDGAKLSAFKIYGDSGAAPEWTSTGTTGTPMADSLFGSTAVLCAQPQFIFIADTGGHLYRLSGADPMMAGQWPTFQCGNRRAGKVLTYPKAIAELPPYYAADGSQISSVESVDVFGLAFGQSFGDYDCNELSPDDYGAAFWKFGNIYPPGSCNAAANNRGASATACNGFGDIVGTGLSISFVNWVPYVWPDGVNADAGPTTLATPGFSDGSAYDINASGTIVGWATGGTTANVFRWSKTGPATWSNPPDNLNAPAGGQAYAYSITDDGRIAGKATFTSGGPFHAFNTGVFPFDLASQAIDLGTMGGTASEAWDMHEAKGTVGRSQIASGYWRGFLLPISAPNLGNSAIYEICGLPGVTRTDWNSAAYGVNKFGQVVGYAQNQNLANRAVLYNDQTAITTDLNTLVLDGGQTPASLGWTLTSARAINDAGVIVGAGVLGGYAKSWIIYPKCQD